jgi:FecR-like protein
MSDDYLWDRSGKPDPEVAKLERVLGTLGAGDPPLRLPESMPAREVRGGVPAFAWAMAASVLVVAGAAALWFGSQQTSGWAVATLEGAPRVGDGPVAASGRIAVGQWLETDATSRARVSVGRIGEVLVEPNTRLRLLEAGDRRQRLHLQLGTVTALILAPPRQFVIETPSARAVDLGCAYTLEVDAQGGALVTVLAGWVSFEDQGRESFIPAGARCATRPGSGPGTPYFTDASNAFKNALAMLDVADGDAARAAALAGLLPEARREDAFTLWHLLARLRGHERDEVYARLAALVPPPAGVTRDGVMAGDRDMLDRWWEQLGFGEVKWWRLWQRGWPKPDSVAGSLPG